MREYGKKWLRALKLLVFPYSRILVFCLASCAAPPAAPLSLQPISFDTLPGWDAGNHEAALDAFRQSCRKFATNPQTVPQKVADTDSSRAAWAHACSRANQTDDADAFFVTYFKPYRAVAAGKGDSGLLTGYYEPLLKGSLTRSERFRFPVWGLPSDWHPSKPYLCRRDIDKKSLWGKAKPLLYVEDEIDRFFLHIQGSGMVELPDGKVVKLAFAGKNNQPYTAIGKYLIDRGEVPANQMCVPKLKEWLRSHPDQAQTAMWKNDSYIFFKMGESDQGAVGAQGVPLTPEGSIAVDPAMLPYGVPVYLNTTLPYSTAAYNRLVVAQDTGSAIKGPLRADLFFGPGERAEQLAGGMKQSAKFFVLLPKRL